MVYRGSKKRIIKPLCEAIHLFINSRNPDVYVEPFVGGANVITEINHGKKIGSDSNCDLVDFLKYLQHDPSMDWVPSTISREMYNEVRKDFRGERKLFPRHMHLAMGWLGSFGGRFYDGGWGGGNDMDRDMYAERRANAKATAEKMGGIELRCCKFTDYNPNDYKNCLFYCDPPYHGTSGYNAEFDYLEFCDWSRAMSERNTILVSEYDMPDDFQVVFEVGIKNCVNSKRVKSKSVMERLFIRQNGGLVSDKPLLQLL